MNAVNLSAQSNGNAPKLITEGSSLETIRHMVASGLGITVLPLSAANVGHYGHGANRGAGEEGGNGMLVTRPFVSPAPFRTVGLAWRVTFPRPKAIDILAMAAGQCRVIEPT